MHKPARWLVVLVFAVAVGFALASRNTSGTYSLPSGNPVVSGTTITSSWANNTLNDISTELTNSLDRQGRGAMLAPLQLANGSNTAPSLTFASETNSGLYRGGSHNVQMLINGSTAQTWLSNGTIIVQPLTLSGGLVSTAATNTLGALTATGAVSLPTTTTIAVSQTTPTANSGWDFTSTGLRARYWKDANGTVHLEATGQITASGGAYATLPFAALPAGMRPGAMTAIYALRAPLGAAFAAGSWEVLVGAIGTDGSVNLSRAQGAGLFGQTDVIYFAGTWYGAQ